MLKQTSDPGARSRGSGRALSWAVALSLALHLVLTPAAAWVGLFAWLLHTSAEEDTSDAEQLRAIPITWLGEEEVEPEVPAPALTAPVAMTEAPSESQAAPVHPPPPEPVPRPAPPEEKSEPREKPKAAAGRPDIAHPVALSGVQSEIVDSNANVNLLLLSDRVREHPLGPRIGKLLTDFPQWSSFFATAELDPIRDLNRILIVGPEFRRSADVVAIIQHRLGREVLRKAVDRLVQRTPRGRWLKAKIPAALAHADRAERLFVLPSPNLLVVAPPHLEKQLLSAPPLKFPAPDGREALVLHVRSPAHALRGLPLSLPDTISWLRLDVTVLENGGAELRVTAEDASPELARGHGQTLSLAINALTNPDLGALGALLGLRSIAFIDPIQLRASGTHIGGQVDVSRAQLERLMSLAEELLAEWNGSRETRPNLAHPSAPR